MDETTSLVYFGCNLAKDLEANMPNLANQPDVVSSKCDEIIRVFSNVKERLSPGQMILGEPHEAAEQNINVGLQEWLRNSRSSAMDLLHAQILGERSALNVYGLPESKMKGSEQEESRLGVMVREMGGRDIGGSALLRGDGGQLQPMDASDSSRGLSSQRQRRRKDDAEKRTIKVPAPRMGNTEIPPEDGYTWRKYGQKEILGTKFPRAYYRCTHQKLYHCPAKKQVQRLDDDPYTFEVAYRGDHTCHMSSTAPSIPPSSSVQVSQEMIQQDTSIHLPLPSTSVPFSHWLSMNIKPSEEGTSGIISTHMHRDFSLIGAGSTSTAGPSTGPYGRDVDYQPVADMADFVFNSGSSNSMELIFSSMEEKWDTGEKQN